MTMPIAKAYLSNLLRRLGLLGPGDRIRFRLEQWRNRKVNRDFRQKNPGIALPPDYLMYESFQLNYHKYFTESRSTAEWLAGLLSKHKALNHVKILDWGCGPGRIIRQLPALTGPGCSFFGTDYNARSIAWCSAHLPGIQFHKNNIEAALPYAGDYFDVIYGISIFTHLSEPAHYAWYGELMRVLAPGGILLLTTQGDNFLPKLSAAEQALYQKGQVVVRGQVKEGHRTFSAFQPPAFMRSLFAGVEILEHICLIPEPGRQLPQDIWIVKKPAGEASG